MSIRQRKPGGNYHAIIWDPQLQKNVWKSTGTSDEKEAGDTAAKYRLEMRQLAAPTLPGAKEIDWKLFRSEFTRLTRVDKTADTLALEENALNKFERNFNPQTSFDLSPLRLEDWKADLDIEGMAPSSINRYVAILRRMGRWGAKRRYVSHTSAEFLEIAPVSTKGKKKEVPAFSVEAVQKLFAAVRQDSKFDEELFLTVCFETPMREGEIEHFDFEDIDWENMAIWIRAKEGWRPKWGKERWFPLSTALRDRLMKFPAKKRTGRVITYKGRPVIRKHLGGRFGWILKRVKPATKGSIHSTRHTWITEMLKKGASKALIQLWVGHVDKKTTEGYAHIEPSAEFRQVDLLPFANVGANNGARKMGGDGRDGRGGGGMVSRAPFPTENGRSVGAKKLAGDRD